MYVCMNVCVCVCARSTFARTDTSLCCPTSARPNVLMDRGPDADKKVRMDVCLYECVCVRVCSTLPGLTQVCAFNIRTPQRAHGSGPRCRQEGVCICMFGCVCIYVCVGVWVCGCLCVCGCYSLYLTPLAPQHVFGCVDVVSSTLILLAL